MAGKQSLLLALCQMCWLVREPGRSGEVERFLLEREEGARQGGVASERWGEGSLVRVVALVRV